MSRLASTEELAGMDMLRSNKKGARTQSIMAIESRLPWCETKARVVFRSSEWCTARQIIMVFFVILHSPCSVFAFSLSLFFLDMRHLRTAQRVM